MGKSTLMNRIGNLTFDTENLTLRKGGNRRCDPFLKINDQELLAQLWWTLLETARKRSPKNELTV
jgi:hypothetical protein